MIKSEERLIATKTFKDGHVYKIYQTFHDGIPTSILWFQINDEKMKVATFREVFNAIE